VPSLTASEFVAKWSDSTRTERAASQEHFIDLCRMLGFPTPNEGDATGDWYAFEKGAEKADGGDGFADVWKRGHFAWEYKGKKKDLDAAYKQLLQYRESLENPPLLVVCDLDRFVVRTNFTGTATLRYEFSLADIAKNPREPLRILRAVMGEPEALRPVTTRAEITEQAARDDDYTFGVLHSRVHELWARGMGTQLREVESGFRYTPTTTFETFPFPRPTTQQREAIAAASRELNEQREGWLNPPGVPEAELRTRTLTNLYNACPTWLAQAHERLDRAVLDAYGWPHDISNEEILTRLLALNLEREAVNIEGSRPRKSGQGTQQRTRNRRAGREQLPLVADPKEKYGREEESD